VIRPPALIDIKLEKLSSLFTPNSLLMSLTSSHPSDDSLLHLVLIHLFILHDYIPVFHQTPEENAPMNPAGVFTLLLTFGGSYNMLQQQVTRMSVFKGLLLWCQWSK